MEYYNFLEIPTYLPTSFKFYYVDVASNYAKGLFEYEGVETSSFEVGRDKEDTPYVLFECDIKETDKQKFYSVMDQLNRRMSFSGHSDYKQACYRILGY